MAFLIDREIAAESEEEFDAEGDRYEELKGRLLGGQTMKYEEMEELLAAAESRNDQRVADALKNVVDDPVDEAQSGTNGTPIAHQRTRNRTGKQSFVVAVDVENSSDYNGYTTKYVKRDKSLTPGLGREDNDRAYRTKSLDDAVKFFADVAEKYPKYSVWLFTDGYSFAPMRQQAMRRNEAHAGRTAEGDWCRGSDQAYAKLIDAEIARRGREAASDLELQRQRSKAANAAFQQKQDDARKQKADRKKWFNDWLAGLNESGREPTKAELLDRLIGMCEPGSGVRNALEEIKDKFALGESAASDPTGAPLDRLDAAIGRLKGAGDLAADDAWIEDSKEIVLSYENVGWYENLDKWAEDPSDDVESDLDKIYGALLESGYGLRYSRKAVEKAIADAAAEAASDPERIAPKENRFGDWDSVATCNVHVPFEIVDGPADVLPEDNEIEEKEELLPDCVVNEAVETLRRMY